jgi:cytochrome P450
MRPLSTAASSNATGPVTAASHQFDPFDPPYQQDPYPVLSQLRANEPVFFSPELGTWVVTRHETVRKVLRDSERFSATIASDPLKPLCPHARAIITGSEFDVPPMLVNNDPPSHTGYRALFSEPLNRPRFESLEPFIRETVDVYLDRLLAGGRPADLVKGLTWDVPALVLFRLLGVPAEDVAMVKSYADSRVVLTWGRPTDDEQVRLATGAVEFFRYATSLVARKEQAPADDYLSDLIRMRAGDDTRVCLGDLSAMAFNLLFAGHETTSSAAANLFKAVLPERDLWSRICSGEQALMPVVEEGLRFDPPVQAWRRLSKEDVELDGVFIPAGSRLLLMFAAANRDPQQFPQPDRFEPDRRNVLQHTSFGMGLHYCLGAPLARLEVKVMLEQVARRIPAMELVAGQAWEYTPNTSFRALRRLMVTW